MARVLLALTVAMHVPVALGVVELARRLGLPFAWPIGFAWGAAGVALLLGRVRGMMPDRKRSELAVRFIDIPYFVHWCAAAWTLVLSVPLTLLVPLVDLARGVPVVVPMTTYMVTYLVGLVVCAYGVLVRRRWFRVVEREVRGAGLDPALDGLRVAQLSDLHVGMPARRAAGRSPGRARGRRAEAGSRRRGRAYMVTSGVDFHDDIAERARGAPRRPLGVFACMGNFQPTTAPARESRFASLLAGRGARVLRNEGHVVEHEGARLWLAAIDDTWTRRDDLTLAMKGRPEGVTTMLLAHDPATLQTRQAQHGAELVLSGQHARRPARGPLPREQGLSLSSFAHKYNVGFYTSGRSTLYVHPGLGTTGPPIRIGAAPEVTVLILRSAA